MVRSLVCEFGRGLAVCCVCVPNNSFGSSSLVARRASTAIAALNMSPCSLCLLASAARRGHDQRRYALSPPPPPKPAPPALSHVHCWRVGFPCGLFPPVWCFPPRCLGAAPLRFFCRAWLLPFFVMSVFSAVPASGRPPGQRHGSGLLGPAAADQRSMHNGHGLPPRAGSEYEGDLHPYGADR